jgi:FAD:protein FMN transferase
MNGFRTVERRVERDIMGTDVLIRIASHKKTKEEMEGTIERALRSMRVFADRFSRFRRDNELWYFNESRGGTVSAELFDLLSRAVAHFRNSGGWVDPSLLPALESEGYQGAYQGDVSLGVSPLSDLVFDAANRSVRKPRDLKLDFGGFGKGYIVDCIANDLGEHYPHVLVDAGGDISVRGSDVGRGETGWVIAVEHPVTRESSDILIRLSNEAVATSGKNRRAWESNGSKRHHLIDPLTRKSSTSDLLSATVIAPDCEKADVLAKTLFLMGKEQAWEKAEVDEIPLLLFDETGQSTINRHIRPYVIAL